MEHSRAEHSPSFARSTSNALIEIHSRVADLLPGTWGVCVTRRAAMRNCCSSFPRSLIAGIFFSLPFFFFFWGWPKVRAYKKKIHTLGRRSVGLSVLADLVVSEACLKCLSISTGRRLLRMQLLENFSHAKQCYSCCCCCCCRRSGVNFPWAQIILDYEAKQVNVN